jgi:hypothetical protein
VVKKIFIQKYGGFYFLVSAKDLKKTATSASSHDEGREGK